MFIWIIIATIALVSIGLSFMSLRSLKDKGVIKDTKNDLAKNRVIYHDSSNSRGE